MAKNKITRLGQEDIELIVNVLCDAFFDYPVMRYVLQNSTKYEQRLRTLMHFFTMARIWRNEVILGAWQKSQLVGVALTSNPDKSIKIPQLIELREHTWQKLGTDAKKHYENLVKIWIDLDTGIPCVHLNMLAVSRKDQGSGAGRKLLEQVHKLSKKDPDAQGVTLSTEDHDKVSFYKYMGYQISGQAKVDNNLQTWVFYRAD